MLGVLPAILLTAIAGTCWISIIAESSEGHDEIQNWNTRYISDWFPSLLYLAAAASASTVPGVLMSIGIGKLVPNGVWSHAALGGATTVIALPLVVLSQLDNDTPWGVISGRIFATLRRCPGSWLLFYIESALLIGGCLAVAAIAALLNVYPLWPMPMYVAAFLLYARLLGRLGWVLAEATAVVE